MIRAAGATKVCDATEASGDAKQLRDSERLEMDDGNAKRSEAGSR